MQKPPILNVLSFEDAILVASASRHLNDITLECEWQEINNRQEIDKSNYQAHRFRSFSFVSLILIQIGTHTTYISLGFFLDISRPL